MNQKPRRALRVRR